MPAPVILWLRTDLRLADNPAVEAACAGGQPVLPVYVLSDEDEGSWRQGAASRVWLHHALNALSGDLARRGSKLLLMRGRAADCLAELAKNSGAERLCYSSRVEGFARRQEVEVAHLAQQGIAIQRLPGSSLLPATRLINGSGRPYQVFTAYHRAFLQEYRHAAPRPAPAHFIAPQSWPQCLEPQQLELLPRPRWDKALMAGWTPGEAGAQASLSEFMAAAATGYAESRDNPAEAATSRLSPHLHFGEISAAQVWDSALQRRSQTADDKERSGIDSFMRQLVWRDFAQQLLWHFPQTEDKPLRSEFSHFPWQTDEALLAAWRAGRTGFPLVDAGMRQLWHEGFMHNRVRMVCASFLVKHLLQPWQEGARWFWDTLVDADLANNSMGWQWVAGCGADAAPYFRVFNPVLQGQRFDPRGDYIRRHVPELAGLPAALIHEPWKAGPLELAACGVGPGDYPAPIVSHEEGRRRALGALQQMKSG